VHPATASTALSAGATCLANSCHAGTPASTGVRDRDDGRVEPQFTSAIEGESDLPCTDNESGERQEQRPELEAEHGSYLAAHYTTQEGSGCCHFGQSVNSFSSG